VCVLAVEYRLHIKKPSKTRVDLALNEQINKDYSLLEILFLY